MMKRPELLRSIRFRLTVIYSTILFALAGIAMGVTYFAVSRTTEPQPRIPAATAACSAAGSAA